MMQQTVSSGPTLIHASNESAREGVRLDAVPFADGETLIVEPSDFSPVVAHELARLIVHHWYACSAAKEIVPDSPLDILDFFPGRGTTTLLMTGVLQRKFPSESHYRWRYLPVLTGQQTVAKLYAVEGIKALMAEGRVVPLYWPSNQEEPSLLLPDGGRHWQPSNPVIALFHDYFAYLPQRLLAVHYGKLMEYAENAPSNEHESEDMEQVSDGRKWILADRSSLDADLTGLFDTYIAKFNSVPIPYPQRALELIGSISERCKQGCLMIAAALGVTTEVKLRLSNFSDLTKCFQNRQTMPINFHLLAHKLTKAKAVTDQLALQKDKVLQLGLFRHQDADTRLRALVRDVDPAMFGHAPALSQAMQGVHGDAAFEHRLTLLKLAAFDPEVLAAIHGPHFARASKHHGFNREGWRQALEQVWSHYLPGAGKDGFHEQVATMAMHCGDWALARRVIQAGIQVRGQNASDLAQLAWCDARTGQLKRSAEIISDALALDPSHVMAREVQQRTEDRLAHWDDRWRQPVEHVELPLVLEPLDLSHAEAMLYQYRDPQIAIMTGLPAITALEAMQQWITEQIQQRQWAHFAIMDADQGFVGYINLAVSEHAAFFCFWTGVDFQGRGLATQAGKLACEFARKLGVSVMLTSAYSDNQRSIRSLERIGFTQIPIRALPPDQERIFYALADPSLSATDAIDELRNYYLREKIALEFPAPENHGRHESSGD